MALPKLLEHLKELGALRLGDLLQFDGEGVKAFQPSAITTTNATKRSWTSIKYTSPMVAQDQVITQVGTGLTCTEGRVLVGAGIKAVTLTARISVNSSNFDEPTRVTVYQIRGQEHPKILHGMFSQTNGGISWILPQPVAVQEGDWFMLTVYDGNYDGRPRSIDAENTILVVTEL